MVTYRERVRKIDTILGIIATIVIIITSILLYFECN